MELAIKERPILFSSQMVQAIQSDRKTVTRRVVKGAPTNRESYVLGIHKGTWGIHADVEKDEGVWRGECPYGQPGDRLWLREAWQAWTEFDGMPPRAIPEDSGINYLADGNVWDARKRPSMFMPRWASRITLEVKSVRVERLQAITEAEAIAEGFDMSKWKARRDFIYLWDQLNADRGYGWLSNPWVWRVEFERIINTNQG